MEVPSLTIFADGGVKRALNWVIEFANIWSISLECNEREGEFEMLVCECTFFTCIDQWWVNDDNDDELINIVVCGCGHFWLVYALCLELH